MFQKQELKRLFPLFVFWAVYSAVFFLWVKTFFYTLPFLLGFLVATAVQPAIAFLDKKLHWNHTLSSAVVTFGALALLFALLVFIGIFAVREISDFILRASRNGFAEFSQPVSEFLNRIGQYLQDFDMGFLERNREEIMDLMKNSMELVTGFLGAVLGFLTSLPTVVFMLVAVVFASFFISRDMDKLRKLLKGILSGSAVFHVKNAAKNSGGMGRKYLFSYLFLYFITFCETYIILRILDLPYPLVTSLITAVADVLPVLGPGFVFLPVSVYQLLIGRYSRALGLLIGWGVISLVRQIVEPQLVSSTVKIHPLAMLAAIYFSLVGKSIWILLYVAGFFVLYAAFRETGALPALTKNAEEKESPAAEKT